MRRSSWLFLATMAMGLAGIAQADPPMDPAVEARFKALEQRISELEQRLSAAGQAPANAAAQAPAVAAPAGTIVISPSAPRPATLGQWKDPGAWSRLKRGMSWSEVNKILGTPGAKSTGVFGDVWFYPDSSGGRVVFDRDSRVSSWTVP